MGQSKDTWDSSLGWLAVIGFEEILEQKGVNEVCKRKSRTYGLVEDRDGARSRTRTGTALLPRDFKSLVSTNFTTRADSEAGTSLHWSL